jgi:ATP-dependent RNA helicase RhlE
VTQVTFTELGLAEPLLRALLAEDYTTPTPIQTKAIPALLEGRDLLGIAQTGTGKTAAFALPILQALSLQTSRAQPKSPRALILAPTRELASQIADRFKTYGRNVRFSVAVVCGGVGHGPQIKNLARGLDVLVATPGRLLDLVTTGHCRLDKVEHFVLDEADRMFDMGFIRDIRKVVKALPAQRQTLLFSATMPADIEKLAREILNQPVKVEVTPKVLTVDKIDQRVIFVDAQNKRSLLSTLLADPQLSRVIVFTRTKHGANKVADHLGKVGVDAEAIHGNKSQGARQKALARFKSGQARVLVATDIASRGIDVDDVTHVINFELPHEPESYVHRIGRTARAGSAGIAYSFCDRSERGNLRDIERLTKRPLAVHPGGGEVTTTDERPVRAVAKPKPWSSDRNRGQNSDRPRPSAPKKPGGGGRRRPRRAAA